MSYDRSRNWCFTLNNYVDEDEYWVYSLSAEVACSYVVCGKEVGEGGTPHLQGYCNFKEKKSLSQVRSYAPRAHWEISEGTPLQASDYCKKDGNFYESGSLPLSQAAKGEAGKAAELARWEGYGVAASEGRLKDIPLKVLAQYGKGILWAVTSRIQFNLSDTTEQMLWYWGASRTGKSRKAREDHPDAYLKMCNKWWDGYQGQDTVIIEDFDTSHSVLCHHLKIWADRYRFPAEFKGGKFDIRPRRIIVTSNYNPACIWPLETDLSPILERFKCIQFFKL